MDWVKLGVRYYADAKIAGLPDDIADSAEVMFTRGLARAGEERAHGFIPGSAIPELTRRRRYEACVDALVASGLWSRVPGGYQVTRWADWQDALDALTKRRNSDAERKRRSRAAAAEAEKAAGSMPDMSRDQPVSRDERQMSRDPDQLSRDASRDVTPPERDLERDLEGGSSRTTTYVARDNGSEPPSKCEKHIHDPDPPPCGGCGRARRANEAWHEEQDRAQRRADALARSQDALQRAQLAALDIEACDRCDHLGKLPNGLGCNHRPAASPGAADAARDIARAAAARRSPTAPVIRLDDHRPRPRPEVSDADDHASA